MKKVFSIANMSSSKIEEKTMEVSRQRSDLIFKLRAVFVLLLLFGVNVCVFNLRKMSSYISF